MFRSDPAGPSLPESRTGRADRRTDERAPGRSASFGQERRSDRRAAQLALRNSPRPTTPAACCPDDGPASKQPVLRGSSPRLQSRRRTTCRSGAASAGGVRQRMVEPWAQRTRATYGSRWSKCAKQQKISHADLQTQADPQPLSARAPPTSRSFKSGRTRARLGLVCGARSSRGLSTGDRRRASPTPSSILWVP
jgi:hypothetical protein